MNIGNFTELSEIQANLSPYVFNQLNGNVNNMIEKESKYIYDSLSDFVTFPDDITKWKDNEILNKICVREVVFDMYAYQNQNDIPAIVESNNDWAETMIKRIQSGAVAINYDQQNDNPDATNNAIRWKAKNITFSQYF